MCSLGRLYQKYCERFPFHAVVWQGIINPYIITPARRIAQAGCGQGSLLARNLAWGMARKQAIPSFYVRGASLR